MWPTVTETTLNSPALPRAARPTVVRVLRDTSALEQIRPTWQGWQTHPNSDIDFYLMVLRERSEIIRPHVMVVDQGDHPQAMLVGRVERKRLAFKAGYLTLMRPKVRLLTLPFGGLLGEASEENCAALIHDIMNSLRRREADVAVFEPVNTQCALFHSARALPPWFCKGYLHSGHPHRTMTLHGGIEAFHRSLSPKVRKNLKWQAKKLLTDYSGEVRVASYASCVDLDVMIHDVEAVAKKTYQRALGVGFLDCAETRARLRLESEKGWLRGFVLYLAGQPCAFWLGTMYRGTFHSNFMGYDPACAKNSPGMFLISKVIEDLCRADGAEKPEQVDFGLGDAQYKEVLGTSVWQEAGVYVFAPSAKGILLNFLKTSLGVLERIGRRVLGRTNLIRGLKAFWRRLAIERF